MRFKIEKCEQYPGEYNLMNKELYLANQSAPRGDRRNPMLGWVGPYAKVEGGKVEGSFMRCAAFDSVYEGHRDDAIAPDTPYLFPTLRAALRVLRREVTLHIISGGTYGVDEKDDDE